MVEGHPENARSFTHYLIWRTAPQQRNLQIKNDEDIINRIKYDIFYIENWSIFLDLKIIFQTFINALKGEEKAY